MMVDCSRRLQTEGAVFAANARTVAYFGYFLYLRGVKS